MDKAYQEILQILMKRVMMYQTIYHRKFATVQQARQGAVKMVAEECIRAGFSLSRKLQVQLLSFKVLA